ncbi:carbon-nitrogen hydrolase family protein [Olivibacter sp. SDN3]|uniref:carbon-nitrogen hydrolase family protein n=1 Tax=Olivibacter sp. SDN3 TaxID=2764720 RepID=UPI001651A35B|nr:carbon-nitrogen hydrolase family protein [Olivibacter sp. SDN3]QNL48101.1 carbon-nitrogen hydrolase family protein [Olivibacter sp. SDN3]
MRIALASPSFPKSIHEGLCSLDHLSGAAAGQKAEVICFPESFIPGYPGMGYPKADRTDDALKLALKEACRIAKKYGIAIILPTDWYLGDEVFNLAHVISGEGDVLGYQTKNQLDPTEDHLWTAGNKRQIFELNKVKFGITICHEGFRYPESVRWAAQRGAQIVFHPHFVGSNEEGVVPTEFGDKENPYYEKAMMMRALENTIYFASVNYASKYPGAATAVIAPDGSCVANQKYGESGVLIVDIDVSKATGLLAKRFKPDLFYG